MMILANMTEERDSEALSQGIDYDLRRAETDSGLE